MLLLNGFGDLGLLVLRIALGIVFLMHGIPKLKMKGSWLLLGIAETSGGLAIVFGFLTQLAALGLAIVMLGAIYMKISKWKVPFTAKDKLGWEYDWALLGIALALVFLGAGYFSLDAMFSFWP